MGYGALEAGLEGWVCRGPAGRENAMGRFPGLRFASSGAIFVPSLREEVRGATGRGLRKCCDPRSPRARDLHPTNEDLILHPNEQKSFAGDPEFAGTPDRGAPGLFFRSWRSQRGLFCLEQPVVSRCNRKATADPSTHHPQTEERLGPLSLRMTGHFMLWTLETGNSRGFAEYLGGFG